MSRFRLPSTASRTLGSGLVIAALGLAVYLFLEARVVHVPAQAAPPNLTATDVPFVPVGRYDDAVPVLVYHDLATRPGRYTVRPLAFAEQMAALKLAGFHTISASQLIAFLRGRRRLPVRPVLLTFDDGLGSAWRVADPVLRRYGFRAVDFVISGQVGHHGFYYLDPGELRAMVGSGRWDIEAHTHLAHLEIQTDKYGDYGPALTNRAWLSREQRLETRAEFASRIHQDLDLNISELRGFGVDPQLFAYPFSASRTPTNDKGIIPILHRIVEERYRISFVDDDGARFLTRYDGADAQQLPRIEVYHDTSARTLLGRLRRLAPLRPQFADALAGHQSWIFEGARGVDVRSLLRGDVLTLRLPARHWLAAYLWPSRAQLWQDYRVGVTVQGLGREGSGTSATVMVGARDKDRYAVTLSAGRLSVERLYPEAPARRLRRSTIAASDKHRLSLALTRERLEVVVDGQRVVTVRVDAQIHGGIGLGGWRSLQDSPAPSFTDVSVQSAEGAA